LRIKIAKLKEIAAMSEPSRLPTATTVMRVATDGATARKLGEALAEVLDAGTTAAAAFEEPDGRWSLAVHFRDPPDEAAVRGLIATAAGAATADAAVFETLAPTDWVRKSLEGLSPVEAGRFVVHGAHARARVRVNRIAIEIEAALAFGTGHHGTTRGCLLALDRIVKARKPRRILDVGTGTGVLAIAAARALHRPVLASDIDLRAVTIARENVRLNRAGAYVEITHASGVGAGRFRRRAPFEMIFANILLEPLQRLATPLARLAAPGSHIVLSGLLLSQTAPALASYRARGLVLVRRIRLEGWATLVLARPGRKGRKFRSRHPAC
jgi:ribosomal protein L11 methyltransferase